MHQKTVCNCVISCLSSRFGYLHATTAFTNLIVGATAWPRWVCARAIKVVDFLHDSNPGGSIGCSPPSAPIPAALIWPERHWRGLSLLLAAFTFVAFAVWVWSLEIAIEAPPIGTIHVSSASWAENCGAPKGNATQWVKSACAGRRECNFVFDWRLLGNPAPTCNKQFSIEWTCSADGPALKTILVPDPMQDAIAPLSCN